MSQSKFLTKENWQEYEEESDILAMYGYMEATEHFIPELEQILLCKTFSEMKDQLTQLFNNRVDFVNSVSNDLGKPK